MAWEIIFMLVILKIPIVYIAVVIWWAIKAEPEPGESRRCHSRIRHTGTGHASPWPETEGPPTWPTAHAGAR